MKLKHFFFATVFCLLFISCSSDSFDSTAYSYYKFKTELKDYILNEPFNLNIYPSGDVSTVFLSIEEINDFVVSDENGNILSEGEIYKFDYALYGYIPLVVYFKDFNNPTIKFIFNKGSLTEQKEFCIDRNLLKGRIDITECNGGIVMGNDNYFSYNETITLQAIANDNYTFDGWYDKNNSLITNDDVYIFPYISSIVVMPKFLNSDDLTPKYTVATTVNDEDGGTVSGGGLYKYDAPVTLKATPKANYVFDGWYDGGLKLSDNQIFTLNAANNINIMANFERETTEVCFSFLNFSRKNPSILLNFEEQNLIVDMSQSAIYSESIKIVVKKGIPLKIDVVASSEECGFSYIMSKFKEETAFNRIVNTGFCNINLIKDQIYQLSFIPIESRDYLVAVSTN